MKNPTHIASTFYFFSSQNANAEKNKKSLQANAPDSADICGNLTQQTNGRKEERTDNTGLAKVAVQCSASTFVVKIATFAKPENVTCKAMTTVLNINIRADNRQNRQRFAKLNSCKPIHKPTLLQLAFCGMTLMYI